MTISIPDGHLIDLRGVIRAKLHPPPCSHDVLFRSRLVEMLAATSARLSVVMAPAGFGKTTLLAQCAEHCSSRSIVTAWFTADDDDCDPSSLVAGFIASVQSSGIDLGDVAESFKGAAPRTHVRVALATLLNRLATTSVPGVLLIDDWHRAAAARTSSILQTLLDNLPAQWRMIIASRLRPDIRLARLASDLNVLQVGAQDLRFTFVEAQRQYRELSDAQLRTIMQHADGWPVALQLARIYLTGPNSAGAIERYTGRTPELASYLAEQVFGQLPLELQDVLLSVSFVRRFNGELINHLCGRSDGWRLLDEIENRHLFLTPTDDTHQWFQLHQLFAEFLQEQCQRRGDLSAAEINRSAAYWFLEHGHMQDAIRHTSVAADPQLACQVIEQAGGWRVMLRSGTPAMRHLTELSSEIAGNRSQLQLARIMLLAKDGHFLLARTAFDELRRESSGFRQWQEGERDLSADGFAIDLILRGYEDRSGDLEGIAALERDLSDREPADAGVAAVLHLLRAQAAYAVGDYNEACRCGEEGLLQCRNADASYLEIFGQLNFGLSLLGRGEVDRAEATYWTALNTASDLLGPENSMQSPLKALLAEIRYLRDDLRGSEELLDEALQKLEKSDTWFDIWASAASVDASLRMAAEGVERGLARLDWAEDFSQRRDMGRLADWALIERVRLLTQSQRLTEAGALADDGRFVELVSGQSAAIRHRFGLWTHAVLAKARLENARGRPQDAVAAMEPLEQLLIERGQVRVRVSVLINSAAAQLSLGNPRAALDSLRDACRICPPEGLRRMFIDETAVAAKVYSLALRAEGGFSQAERAFLRAILVQTSGPGEPGHAVGAEALEHRNAMSALSPLESQILSFLVAGLTNKEIARQLTISESTVVTHRRRLYRKLKVSSRSRAIAVAREMTSSL
jgi:LuxR family maltose regulon positive regulatory protein